jgi:hypothetical protein
MRRIDVTQRRAWARLSFTKDVRHLQAVSPRPLRLSRLR